MKFVCAVVMLALAVGVQSSLHGPAFSYSSAVIHTGWPHAVKQAPAAIDIHSSESWGHSDGKWDHSGSWGHGGYPGISLSQGPAHGAPVAIAYDDSHGHGHGHEGIYIAKTLGAIHKAPLAGHINSATSLNLAPAPGTH